MSIFTRLFKGAEDGEKDPADDAAKSPTTQRGTGHGAAPVEARASQRARKPTGDQGHASIDGKGSMRPTAPPIQINPPLSERSAAVKAAPVVQVAGPDSMPGTSNAARQAAPPYARPQQQAPASLQGEPAIRTKVIGTGTARLGTNAAPMAAPQGNMQSAKPSSPVGDFPGSSGAQRVGPAPPFGTSGRASPPASLAAGSVRGAVSRTKAGATAANIDRAKAPSPVPSVPDPGLALDGLLTLELGTSPSGSWATSPPVKRGAATAQALAPAAQAGDAAARAAAAAAHEAEAAAWAMIVPDTSRAFEDETNLHSDLDAAFGAMVEAPDVRPRLPSNPELPPSGASELRNLFASLAVNHMRQVREFMIGVKWGEAPRDWVPICEPAVASLLRAAREMELADLCAALDGYREALGRATAATGTTIDEGTRESLMGAYGKLVELMPEAFGLDGERGRRETIIVHALLQQVPEVRKVTIDKIYAAGLTNLDHLFVARPDEISATTGIGENVAASIVEKFQRYRREIASLADATRAAERKRLGELAGELRSLHQEFERAASGWSDDERADKKKFRQARAEALLQVKVLLARMGEVDRLSLIDRLPFVRKIDELEAFLRETKPKEAPTL